MALRRSRVSSASLALLSMDTKDRRSTPKFLTGAVAGVGAILAAMPLIKFTDYQLALWLPRLLAAKPHFIGVP